MKLKNKNVILSAYVLLIAFTLNYSFRILPVNAQILTTKSSPPNVTEITNNKNSVLNLMRNDPIAFFSGLSAYIQSNIVREVSIRGKLAVIAVDDSQFQSHNLYYLSVGNETLEFFPAGKMQTVRSGTEISVSGYRLDNTVVSLIDKDHFHILKEANVPEALGEQKTLVVLIDYLNSGPEPFTPEQISSTIFDGQFQKFYAEQSYRKIHFSGDVIGWYTKQCDYVVPVDLCQKPSVLTDPDLRSFISNHGLDLRNYLRVVYLVNNPNFSTFQSTVGAFDFTISGITYHFSESIIGGIPGSNNPWANHPFEWTILDYHLAHEIGHGLGVVHANGLDCGDQSLTGNCSTVNYGNSYDNMGQGDKSLHFNSFYKEFLGWIQPSEEVLITASGAYNVGILESASSTIKLAKIQMEGTNEQPFYLENRKAVGFDRYLSNPEVNSNQNGLFVNLVDVSGPFLPTQLIDSSPTSETWWNDILATTLNNHNTLVDQARGISIELNPHPSPYFDRAYYLNNQFFIVNISAPKCQKEAPNTSSDRYSSQVSKGSTGYVSFGFINNDSAGCGQANFSVTISLPQGWQSNLNSQTSDLLSPKDESLYINYFTIPQNASVGLYTITATIRNNSSGYSMNKHFLINVSKNNLPSVKPNTIYQSGGGNTQRPPIENPTNSRGPDGSK